MSALALVLTVGAINGSTITYKLPVNTAMKPAVLVQSTSPAVGKKRVSSDAIRLSIASVDAAGNVLAERDSVELVIKRAAYSTGANQPVLLSYLRDIIQSNEFETNVWNGSSFIKAT